MSRSLPLSRFQMFARAVARAGAFGLAIPPAAGAAQSTNSLAAPVPAVPGVVASLVNVLAALALVLALFFGCVWLIRNWQRLMIQRGRAPRLNVLEARSLGGRHALYVIGYEQERFLIAASPAGVQLVSHLQPTAEDAPAKTEAAAPASFALTLKQMLKGK